MPHGHKGKGYQVQVAETYSTDKEELSLITYVEVEGAHINDSDALIPYIEATIEREPAPEQVLADTAYGGDSNREKAKELGVEVVSPCAGRHPKGQYGLVDFTFFPDGKVVACPRGHAPLKTQKKRDSFNAIFPYETCGDCDECPARPGGAKSKYLRYSTKELRLVRRKAFEETTEFLDKYRFRAGIEATMSQLDRRTGLKHLRVRGMRAVRFCAFLKATGINILRAAAFKCGQNKDHSPIRDPFSIICKLSSVLHALIMFVKEQFRLESVTLWRNILGVDLEFQFCLNQAILLFTRPSKLYFCKSHKFHDQPGMQNFNPPISRSEKYRLMYSHSQIIYEQVVHLGQFPQSNLPKVPVRCNRIFPPKPVRSRHDYWR